MGEENLNKLAFEPDVRSWQLAFYCVGLVPLTLVRVVASYRRSPPSHQILCLST